MDEATVENLQETGLYHLFAISGGHIAIINVLLFSLFRFVRMSRRASSLALAVFLVFYTVLVEGSPSVLRATLMTLAFLAGKLLWKDVHVLNTIAASAFVLLLANPSSLFDIGFQLTYAATLTIILFTPPLLKRLPRLPLKTTELVCLSVTAALGAAPIIARSFNRDLAVVARPEPRRHPSRRRYHGHRLRLPAVRGGLPGRGRASGGASSASSSASSPGSPTRSTPSRSCPSGSRRRGRGSWPDISFFSGSRSSGRASGASGRSCWPVSRSSPSSSRRRRPARRRPTS